MRVLLFVIGVINIAITLKLIATSPTDVGSILLAGLNSFAGVFLLLRAFDKEPT